MAFRVKFGVEFHNAFGTDAVCQLQVGMVSEILFNLIPVSLVIAYLFAVATDGQKAAENPDFLQGFFQFVIFDAKFCLGFLDL